MKNAACYCRVSTDEQVKFGFSIQAQVDALKKYCKENNYKYEFYIDEGISASTMKRPALQNMLKKINDFDIVLFTKLDRLSRNVLDANNINKILNDNNCTMKAIDEDDIDTSTADGTFIFNLKVSLAQREIGKTSERIKFVFQNKREKREVTSGTCKYGYKIENKKFVINNEEAENIINLYKYFISVNGSISKAYQYFIEHFNGKGYDAFSSYLRDTAYIGKYKLYRKNIYIDDYIPRIMEDELFYNVQDLLKKKQYSLSKNKEIALFAGILYCNKCGIRLTKNQDNRSKKMVIRYFCDNARRFKVGSLSKKCSNKSYIREDNIENYLLKNLYNEAQKYKAKYSISNLPSKIADNTSKINTLKKKLSKLKDLYLEDLIDKSEYEHDYTKYKKELSDLQSNYEEKIQRKDFSKLNKILNSGIINIYNSLSREEKRKFWLSIIDKIYVEDNQIKKITFL